VLFAVRVSSDKQTLILAGEATPPRRAAANRTSAGSSGVGSQLQRVTVLLVQGEYAAGTLAADSSQAKFLAAADSERALLASSAALDAPAVSDQGVLPHPASGRAPSAAAAEYARMQSLSGASTRIQLIDTYA
jgi:hypothetical protein